MDGERPLADWQRQARRRLPKFAFDYLEGGADCENALKRNLAAIRQICLVPDRMTDVTNCTIETKLFGATIACPFIVGPTGLNGLFWRDGDLALARAAARVNVPFVMSTASTSTMDAVARSSSGDNWFQLYVLANRKISEQLMSRASEAGFRVLVVTVDVPISGNRVRDIRNGFRAPMSVGLAGICNMLMHPRWLFQIIAGGIPDLVNIRMDAERSDLSAKAALLQRQMDRSFTWSSIEWVRAHWRGPIVLKGIMSPSDAVRAYECGADGIIVSNHGGRQLDSAPASIEMLEEVVSEVANRLTVLVDSGFRRGPDILKALALGAKAVLIGRPALYGLAAAGERGVLAVLQTLKTEIEANLTLMGLNDLVQLQQRHLYKNPLM